jgi:hypothetical protein
MIHYKQGSLTGKEGKMLCYERGGHLLILVQRCFDVNEKKVRCFSPLAQKVGSIGFVHNKANNSETKGKSKIESFRSFLQIATVSFSSSVFANIALKHNKEKVLRNIIRKNLK